MILSNVGYSPCEGHSIEIYFNLPVLSVDICQLRADARVVETLQQYKMGTWQQATQNRSYDLVVVVDVLVDVIQIKLVHFVQ